MQHSGPTATEGHQALSLSLPHSYQFHSLGWFGPKSVPSSWWQNGCWLTDHPPDNPSKELLKYSSKGLALIGTHTPP